MGAGAVLEPLVVVVLLFGGAWINRATDVTISGKRRRAPFDPLEGLQGDESDPEQGQAFLGSKSRSSSPSLLPQAQETWRTREVNILGFKKTVVSPNTARFQHRLLSRVLRKFPFLAECWYWALIYWTYQLGRALTAVTLKDDTVDVARKHALQLIDIEQKLNIFLEVPIQQLFLRHPMLMKYINWLYSFIHIPGTIAFLVWLYYYTITRNRLDERQPGKPRGTVKGSPAGAELYQARRRTMAVCNLLAFIVFTLWPCMPPRLLSDKSVKGKIGEHARSFGFVDTVHGKAGAGSVWTENRFCNQYAAMPSLHFGYSLMIGLSIMMIPLPPQHRRSRTLVLLGMRLRLPSWRRAVCLLAGFLYPFSILVAIVSTANHFILDALAGAVVCGLGWKGNTILLNLLPLEDYFLWLVRIHKPSTKVVDVHEPELDSDDETETGKGVLAH